MKRIVLQWLLFIFLIFQLQGSYALAGDGRFIFSTCDGFEVDKCASIWLIKRFVDKDAQIKIFPKGSAISEGILFDVPEAKLRRYHNMSTFESILKHYNLQDPKLTYIGKIVHDIEVNIWEKKLFSETPAVEKAIFLIIKQSKDKDELIERSCQYFDSLYQKIKSKNAIEPQSPRRNSFYIKELLQVSDLFLCVLFYT